LGLNHDDSIVASLLADRLRFSVPADVSIAPGLVGSVDWNVNRADDESRLARSRRSCLQPLLIALQALQDCVRFFRFQVPQVLKASAACSA
jgi:hypothetical protein